MSLKGEGTEAAGNRRVVRVGRQLRPLAEAAVLLTRETVGPLGGAGTAAAQEKDRKSCKAQSKGEHDIASPLRRMLSKAGRGASPSLSLSQIVRFPI